MTNTRQSGPVNHPTGDGVDDELDGQLAVIRNELFVFLAMKMWRFSDRGVLRYNISGN